MSASSTDTEVVDPERVGSVRLTARRLEGVQAAVNAMLDDVTAQYVAEVANDEIDMAEIWGIAVGTSAGTPASSLKIRSNAQCLKAFLSEARRILAPTVEVDGRWLLVPILDLGGLGHRALTQLRTSNGHVWRRGDQEYACWQVVGEK